MCLHPSYLVVSSIDFHKKDKSQGQYSWIQNYCCEYYYKWMNCHKDLCFLTISGCNSLWTCTKKCSLLNFYQVPISHLYNLIPSYFPVKHPCMLLGIVFEGILQVKLDVLWRQRPLNTIPQHSILCSSVKDETSPPLTAI